MLCFFNLVLYIPEEPEKFATAQDSVAFLITAKKSFLDVLMYMIITGF